MARLSQGLIQGLTRPAFSPGTAIGQGMLGMGQAFTDRRNTEQEQQQNKGMLNLAQIASMGAQPESIAAMQNSLAARTGASAKDLLVATETGKEQRQQSQQNAALNKYLKNTGNEDLIGLAPKQAIGIAKQREGAKNKKKEAPYKSAGGGVVYNEQTGEITYTSPEEPIDWEEEGLKLADSGKYTTDSIQEAVKSKDISQLVSRDIGGPTARGEVPASVERQFGDINKESTKAALNLSRNRDLQNRLLTQPSKSTGIVSDIRTAALDVAGLRDAEEITKTAFLRDRNTQIINALPPGVATDRDIQVFAQGFPKDNASSEEILRYLAGEEKALAYQSDLAVLADRHLQRQVNAGQKASMVGFIDNKNAYGKIMQTAERRINEARQSGDIERERMEIRALSEVLGFVPTLYK